VIEKSCLLHLRSVAIAKVEAIDLHRRYRCEQHHPTFATAITRQPNTLVMRLLSAGALAFAVGTAHGFRDTSPFFMFSTSKSANLHDEGLSANLDSRLRTASSLTADVSSILSQCPTDLYVIISQPGVRPSDYASTRTTPGLSRKIANGKKQGIRSSTTIHEVVGNVDVESWHNILESECGAQIVEVDAAIGIPTEQKTMPVVYNVWLPAPTTPEDLTENDAFFASVMDIVPSQTYTVLYVTSPGKMSRRVRIADSGLYEMDVQAQETLHIDLRRDLSSGLQKRANNETLVDGPLFDRYQFLTPGER
jgi:hypothetical protein